MCLGETVCGKLSECMKMSMCELVWLLNLCAGKCLNVCECVCVNEFGWVYLCAGRCLNISECACVNECGCVNLCAGKN